MLAANDLPASLTDEAIVITAPEVFVCIHNAGRSQMAAAILHHHAGGRVSASVEAVRPPARRLDQPRRRAGLAEIGRDLSDEFPKELTDDAVRAADVVNTMGCGDACDLSRQAVSRLGAARHDQGQTADS